ncbi:MAG TPA: MarR family transcriptional regulator [Syntrophomonadaceae bacterium]|nr:MarR family transcriptional regulator [Syntrophomonadaceae bacterium]
MKQQREAGFLITKIHHLSGRIFTRKLKENKIEELNPAQGRIMFVLWRSNGISIQELARETGLGKSTLTSMLDRLEIAGHITRISSGEDRRKTLIVAHEPDEASMNKYVRVSQKMNELFYQGFKPDEIDKFESYLRRVLANLSNQSLEKDGGE